MVSRTLSRRINKGRLFRFSRGHNLQGRHQPTLPGPQYNQDMPVVPSVAYLAKLQLLSGNTMTFDKLSIVFYLLSEYSVIWRILSISFRFVSKRGINEILSIFIVAKGKISPQIRILLIYMLTQKLYTFTFYTPK